MNEDLEKELAKNLRLRRIVAISVIVIMLVLTVVGLIGTFFFWS